jgi:hypothetical protein
MEHSIVSVGFSFGSFLAIKLIWLSASNWLFSEVSSLVQVRIFVYLGCPRVGLLQSFRKFLQTNQIKLTTIKSFFLHNWYCRYGLRTEVGHQRLNREVQDALHLITYSNENNIDNGTVCLRRFNKFHTAEECIMKNVNKKYIPPVVHSIINWRQPVVLIYPVFCS